MIISNQSGGVSTLARALTGTLALFLFALAVFAVAFLYQFIQTYHQWLTKGVFYLAGVLGVALAILIAAFTAYGVCMLMLRIEQRKAEHQATLQNIQTITANNSLFESTANQIAGGHVYLSEQRTEQGIVKFKALPKHAKTKLDQPKTETVSDLRLPEPETLPEIKTSLLEDIRDFQRIMLVGGQNSGKTTLLKHIAKQRDSVGSVLVLDSHNTAGKWASHYRIVGHGRDYPAIEQELKRLVEIMDTRYKELASGKIGERKHELITVISDEWTTVSKNLQNLDNYLLPLLTESRKVGIDLILATHSQTAESLGLKGKADLKSAFDAVLILKNISGKRLVDLDNGETISNYHHCGAFNSDNYYKPELIKNEFQNKLDSILNNPIVTNELQTEQQIIDQYHALRAANAFSLSKLSKAIYGASNGRYIAKIKTVLESHGIATT